MTKVEKQLGLIALLSLVLGVILYAAFRPASSAVLLPNTLAWQPSFMPALFYNLPSLIHSFGLTLLTISALGLNKRSILLSASTWIVIGVAFEVLQNSTLSELLLNQGLKEQSILGRYFYYGTFDLNDIIFTAIGAALAIAIALRRKNNE